jgi:hypothetical protein
MEFQVLNIHRALAPLALVGLLLTSCEKEITIDVPDSARNIVFEGYVENGTFPYVIITRSSGYFDPINTQVSALAEVIVRGADVFVTVDGTEYRLDQLCLADLPDSLQGLAYQFLGIPVGTPIPPDLDLCVYLSFNPALTGQVGKRYDLRAVVEGTEFTATTRIPELVSLDSLWFKPETPNDTLGYIWATLTDPDTIGNSYRLATKRYNEDVRFLAGRGNVSNDRLFNAQKVQFGFGREEEFFSTTDEDTEDIESGKFKVGDTVVVKFTTIELPVYRFWETVGQATAGGANPFGSPILVESNIQGGARGIWGGYGATFDTLIVLPQ